MAGSCARCGLVAERAAAGVWVVGHEQVDERGEQVQRPPGHPPDQPVHAAVHERRREPRDEVGGRRQHQPHQERRHEHEQDAPHDLLGQRTSLNPRIVAGTRKCSS